MGGLEPGLERGRGAPLLYLQSWRRHGLMATSDRRRRFARRESGAPHDGHRNAAGSFLRGRVENGLFARANGQQSLARSDTRRWSRDMGRCGADNIRPSAGGARGCFPRRHTSVHWLRPCGKPRDLVDACDRRGASTGHDRSHTRLATERVARWERNCVSQLSQRQPRHLGDAVGRGARPSANR